MKILITGIFGQMGWNLAHLLHKEGHRLFGTFHQNRYSCSYSLYPLNLANPSETSLFSLPKVDLILHCAAYTAVDKAESEPDLALRINVLATERLVSLARRQDSEFVYLSTDFVFDGFCGGYHENSATNPKGVYARSKALGERPVLNYKKGRILRFTPFGHPLVLPHHPKTLSQKLLQPSAHHLFHNKTFSPVSALQILDSLKNTHNKSGIFHVALNEALSVFEAAKRFQHKASIRPGVKPSSWPDNPYTAIRPRFSHLTSLFLPAFSFDSVMQAILQP